MKTQHLAAALVAIQGLNQKLTEELKSGDTEIVELKQRLDALEKSFAISKTIKERNTMKTKQTKPTLPFIYFCILHSAFCLSLCAQTTTVTYQGRVLTNGTNFIGTGQFKFALVTSTNANRTATATANISGAFVTTYAVTFGGNGYVSPPAVTIFGGGGSGATAHATLSGGVVTALTADNPGSGYTSVPGVLVAPPPPNLSYTTYWSNDGTSSAGSQPALAVNVPVTGGLFTVVLGNNTVPNMAVLDASLFLQPNLQLRIWFNDGANGFAALDPAQNLTTAPYAAVAQKLAGGFTVQNTANGAPNVIGGASVNFVTPGVVGATIGGGGATNFFGLLASNSVIGDFGTVGGGVQNTASNRATVGGGYLNIASDSATVGGGAQNRASGGEATVGGGSQNRASGVGATVGGGSQNVASGDYATVSGGFQNIAQGNHSFAAGVRANALHDSSFVWADSSSFSPFSSTTHNQFLIRAAGGVGIGTTTPSGTLALGDNNPTLHLGSTPTPGWTLQKIDNDNRFRIIEGTGGNQGTAGERVTILYGGNVGIGTASPAGRLHVAGGLAVTGTSSPYTGAGTGVFIETGVGSGQIFAFDYTPFVPLPLVLNGPGGNVGIGRTPAANKLEVEGIASKTVAGSWLANSDARIKTDVQPVTGALAKLAQVRPVAFRYTEEYRAQHPSIEDRPYLNVIAQEFQKVFPDAVKSSGDKLPNGDNILQVDTYPLTIYSAAAIQELNQKLEAQRAENAELKQRLGALEKISRSQKSN